MTEHVYDKKIREIKSALGCYSRASVLRVAAVYLHESRVLADPIARMPWLVMFLIKLSMLGGGCGGRDVMGMDKFYSLMNKLLDIQHLAADIYGGDLMLRVRPMVLQQSWYQGSTEVDVNRVFRQMHWFSGVDDFYCKRFEEISGISLYSFYTISLYILVCYLKEGGVARFNLFDIIFRLCPSIPVKHIEKYFVLVGVRVGDLPGFFGKYRIKGELNQRSEYFQPTPLRFRPVLLDGGDALVLNRSVFSGGVSSLVPDLLKERLKEKFKDRFGPDMESYVGNIISRAGLDFIDERGIKDVYSASGVGGKVSDYLIRGVDNILIECKAIEPGDIVKSSFDADLLCRMLSDSFIHAIEQGQETAHILSGIDGFSGARFRLVVVTHEDFWFSTGADVARLVDKELERRVLERFGDVAIPLDEVIYMPVVALEAILELHARGDASFHDVVGQCINLMNSSGGERLTTTHVVSKILKGKFPCAREVLDAGTKWVDEFPEMLRRNEEYWKLRKFGLISARQSVLSGINRGLDSLDLM